MRKVKLLIPTDWSDITVGMYQQYIQIQQSKESDKVKVVKSLSMLCDTTEDIVLKMNYKDLVEIMDILKKMLDAEPDRQEFRKTFEFKGERYGFCPNLSGISTGEYIDLEAYCKDDPIDNLHIIMSILYRKITFERGDRYAIEPYNPEEFKEELFKDCPMDIAVSSLGFFLTLGLILERNSASYLSKHLETP